MFRLGLALRFLVVFAAVGAVLFGAAGRLDLPFFHAYLALFAFLALATVATLPADLLAERARPGGPGRDDLRVLRAAALAAFVAQWVTAGLDVGRFHWTDSVPRSVQVAALAGLGAMFAVWYAAMRVNPFFSAAVRVQHERGHRVVTAGPYRVVRHPGYAAFVLLGWSGAVALGSWWATLPHLVIVALFVRRTAIEDRMLHEELPGYASYAATVRYRLLLGIW